LRPRAILRVSAADDLSGISSVAFYANHNGGWDLLYHDQDGSDGWIYLWPTNDVAGTTVKLRAVLTDYSGNQNTIELSNIFLSNSLTVGSGFESRGGSNPTTDSSSFELEPTVMFDPEPILDNPRRNQILPRLMLR